MTTSPQTHEKSDSGSHQKPGDGSDAIRASRRERASLIFDPDAEAVAACQAGDSGRFCALVERYKDPLVSTIHRIVDDHATSEDLAQDAFVRAFTGIARFRHDARFSTWLFGIGVNIARDFLRKKRRDERARDHAADAAARRAEQQKTENEPLDEAIALDAAERFRQAFARLPADYRVAFALRVRDGLSYEEMAEMTTVAPATLRMRVWRARESLREMMGDPGAD